MTPNAKKQLTLAIGVGLILVSVAITAWTSWPQKKFADNLSYFSDDDGKTWYIDSREQIPPYQHNGHEAVGAALYNTAKNSTPFCGYLYRFPSSLKARIESAGEGKKAQAAYGSENGLRLEVKAPKSNSEWYAMQSPQGNSAMTVKSLDGSELDRVLP